MFDTNISTHFHTFPQITRASRPAARPPDPSDLGWQEHMAVALRGQDLRNAPREHLNNDYIDVCSSVFVLKSKRSGESVPGHGKS